MSRRIRSIFILSIMLILLTISLTSNASVNRNAINAIVDESVSVPEPTGNGNVPDNVKWDSRLGMYISNDYYYDADNKCFIEQPKYDKDYMNKEAFRNEEWQKNNADAKNKLSIALLNWEKNEDTKPSLSSIKILENDPAFQKNVLSLGIDYVPDMLNMLFTERVWGWEMTSAIQSITGISCLPDDQILDSSECKIKQWKETFIGYMMNVEQYANDEETVYRLGIFALPTLSERIANGDKTALSTTTRIINNYEGKLENDSSDYDITTIKSWLSENQKTIEIITQIISDFKNGKYR